MTSQLVLGGRAVAMSADARSSFTEATPLHYPVITGNV
jgi:hypothetical protein